MKPGTFRHYDHKFEWSREEFQDWCNHICTRFPDYCVQFHGIGKPPDGFENLGCCSQLGLFLRKDFLSSLDGVRTDDEENIVPVEELIACDDYKLILSIQYPFFHDKRNRDEKILDEISYHLNRFQGMEEIYFNYDTDRFEIPLGAVANACWQVTDDIQEIRSVMKGNFRLENDFVIFPPNESEEENIAPI